MNVDFYKKVIAVERKKINAATEKKLNNEQPNAEAMYLVAARLLIVLETVLHNIEVGK